MCRELRGVLASVCEGMRVCAGKTPNTGKEGHFANIAFADLWTCAEEYALLTFQRGANTNEHETCGGVGRSVWRGHPLRRTSCHRP